MKPFVILGASKTGTTTAVAAANSHPSVFCLFEADFSHAAESGRNPDLAALLPDSTSLFGRQNFAAALRRVAASLAAKGWPFERVGTKVQGIRPDLLPALGDAPVLFMVRDVRRWAVKNRVIRDVMAARTPTNIVPFLIDYGRFFLDAFALENCRRLPLDNVLSTDLTVLPQALAKLLDMTQNGFERWWQKAPVWKTAPPKNYSSWIDGHTSAFLPPLLSDTNSELALHPFWDAYLPIFDKYFTAPDKAFTKSELSQDQKSLDEIGRTHTITLNEGFARFQSFKIRNLTKLPDGKLSLEGTDRVTQADIDDAADRWRPETS